MRWIRFAKVVGLVLLVGCSSTKKTEKHAKPSALARAFQVKSTPVAVNLPVSTTHADVVENFHELLYNAGILKELNTYTDKEIEELQKDEKFVLAMLPTANTLNTMAFKDLLERAGVFYDYEPDFYKTAEGEEFRKISTDENLKKLFATGQVIAVGWPPAIPDPATPPTTPPTIYYTYSPPLSNPTTPYSPTIALNQAPIRTTQGYYPPFVSNTPVINNYYNPPVVPNQSITYTPCYTPPVYCPTRTYFNPSPTQNSSYYGQLNQFGIPKTVYVRPYFKSDGTYVRDHYRSPPRK